MRPIAAQDHYEVLEVERGADAADLERAYQIARATWAEDSLAGYSIFDDGDASVMRERIDLAYRVLSDAEARRAYDASLSDPQHEPGEPPALPSEPLPVAAAPKRARAQIDDFEEDGADYDGSRLRRSRLRRGLEIDDVARRTKVNPTYLRFLEEENFADLPARVYVRGFVIAYATCVGLEPQTVARSYLQRFDAAKPAASRFVSKGG